MKARPQGARVVPIVATTARMASRSAGATGRRPAGGLAPVGCGEEAGDDVRNEDRAEREQHVFDAVEAAA